MQNRIEPILAGQRLQRGQPVGQDSENETSKIPAGLAQLAKRVESGVIQHPAISLSVGLAIGAAIGWYLKRK